MNTMDMLRKLRDQGGNAVTRGLQDEIIQRFAANHPLLRQAVEEAYANLESLRKEYPDVMGMDEWDQVRALQQDFVNFYQDDVVNPYVPLAARGPWIVTSKGAVIHDNGGYGMLGHGHAPQRVLDAMNQPHVMANIMTASFSQAHFARQIRREIGQRRDEQPFAKYLCMNSGSEAVTVACRIADVNAKLLTDPGAKYEGRTIKRLALTGAFHGRTDRPARFSHSSRKTYVQHLASFRNLDDLVTVEPNNLDALKKAFQDADKNNVFFEAVFMEPVMGEGNPGMAVTPEFYALARRLSKEHGALLMMDSIQAGLRTTGYLSITDYPGFEKLEGPDMETYSKALNAGQYPLSVLAMNERAASLYRKGIYGNTMTANPRALDVGCAVLEAVTPELRANIVARGREFIEKFERLAKELGDRITRVQGTGLLFSCELDARYKCYGENSTEEYMRMQGVGVIHGGANSLRFTPHFAITSEEVDLIVAATRDALLHGPNAEAEPKRASA